MAKLPAKKKDERKSGLPPISLRAAEGAVRGGSSWFGGAGGGGLFSGGGLLSGGGWSLGAASLGGKIAVALLLTALGVGAFGVGRMLAPHDVDADLAPQRLAFDSAPKTDKTAASSLPGGDASGSAMQVIPESLDGKTPEQRAAEAAAKAEAERKAREAAEAAAKAAQAEATPKIADVTPPPSADLTAEASKKNPFTTKFGALTQFGGAHGALNGGAGMSGGVKGFEQKALAPGEPKGMAKAAATHIAARAVSRLPSSRARGFAFRQLDRANGMSRAGAASTGETSSTLADSAFSNAPISGQAVTGGGAGTQALGGAGTQTGGPVPGNENTSNNGTQAPPDAQHQDSSQWKQIAMAGAGALAGGMMLLMMAAQKIQAGNKQFQTALVQYNQAVAMGPAGAAQAQAAQAQMTAAQQMIQSGQMMAMLAAAMGAAAAGVGALLWKQFHQKQYGMIFVGAGGLLAALAMVVMASGKTDGGASEVGANAANGVAASQSAMGSGVSGSLGATMGSAAPAAASPAAAAGSYVEAGVANPMA